jgi:hypothetical protein
MELWFSVTLTVIISALLILPILAILSVMTIVAGRRRARTRGEVLWQFLTATLDVRKAA